MKVFFERKEELAPTIWQYYFRPERLVSFVAGQYVSLHLPTVTNDSRGKSRTFTFTSLPDDKLLSFVAKYDQPASAYKQVLNSLSLGAEAKIDDAMGDLVLPKSTETPLVWLAGGIGIASYVSMARLLSKRHEERDIRLFYNLRNAHERIFQDDFTSFHTSVIVAPGRLKATQISDDLSDDALIYISGSQKFVEGLRTGLETQGIARERIVFDYFDGYAEL